MVDESVEIPNIDVIPEMEIVDLGSVETMIENSVLVKGQTSGEYRVLDAGSLLCLKTRQVIGTVAETLGRVEEPFYCIRFPSSQRIADFELVRGTTVYYVPQHSVFVFTKSLQAVKGSDASNLHDEEVGADEMEFSDDEAEAEYKKAKKLEKQAKKSGRTNQGNGRGQGCTTDAVVGTRALQVKAISRTARQPSNTTMTMMSRTHACLDHRISIK